MDIDASTLFGALGLIVIFRWFFIIKRNSDEQVKQNREIIALLKQNGKKGNQ